jgi:hypothetical protein
MPKYIVRTVQLFQQYYEVEAENEEEAIQRTETSVEMGFRVGGGWPLGLPTFIRYVDSASWTVERTSRSLDFIEEVLKCQQEK